MPTRLLTKADKGLRVVQYAKWMLACYALLVYVAAKPVILVMD
jgi:hypothetical protein